MQVRAHSRLQAQDLELGEYKKSQASGGIIQMLDQMMADVEKDGSLNLGELIAFTVRADRLLQHVIRERLFVGTLAGGGRSAQLTVGDPTNPAGVRQYPAPLGNQTPKLLRLLEGLRWLVRELGLAANK